MLLSFWYQKLPRRFFVFFKRFAFYLSDRLGIIITLKNFFKPLFHDYTKVGRILGFIFRSLYLVAAVIMFVFALGGLLFLFAFVFIIPLISGLLVLSNLSNFGLWIIFALSLSLLFIIYLVSLRLPSQTISDQKDCGKVDLKPVLTPNALSLYKASDANYLLFSLIRKPHVRNLVQRLGVPPEDFAQFLTKELRIELQSSVKEVFQEAYEIASRLNANYISTEHIFFVLFSKPQLRKAFSHFNIEFKYLEPTVLWSQRIRNWEHPPMIWEPRYELKLGGGFNRSWIGVVTPTLDRFSDDLTVRAQKGRLRRFLGNKEVLENLVTVLSRNQNNSAILIGPPGCGKTSLVYGIAHQIVTGGVADSIADKRLVKLDILGSKELRENLDQIVKEILTSENVILFIDEIHTLPPDAYAVLEPPLSDSRFQLVAACSLRDYRRFIEKHGAFARVLQKVELPEADKEITMRILEYIAVQLERESKVTVTYSALYGAYTLADRFVMDRVMPDKAVDLLDETVAMVSSQQSAGIVGYDDIAEVVHKTTHIPVQEAVDQEADKLLNLEERIHQRLIDQEPAVKAVSNAIRRVRSGLVDEDRPVASFLFVGPTGVGKTETAKALAENYYGGEDQMIRFDMSEFQEPGSAERLLDSLTNEIRTRPFSLVLLDEFEKANRDILNLFLQVMEDGRLTNTEGRTVKFTQAMIITTSNAGSDLIFKGLKEGKSINDLRDPAFEALQDYFRPELLNRFDDVILFKPLDPQDMIKIAGLKINELKSKLADKKIELNVSPGALEILAEKGYDPSLGARPLRRLIQDELEANLAKKLLSGELKKGDTLNLEDII